MAPGGVRPRILHPAGHAEGVGAGPPPTGRHRRRLSAPRSRRLLELDPTGAGAGGQSRRRRTCPAEQQPPHHRRRPEPHPASWSAAFAEDESEVSLDAKLPRGTRRRQYQPARAGDGDRGRVRSGDPGRHARPASDHRARSSALSRPGWASTNRRPGLADLAGAAPPPEGECAPLTLKNATFDRAVSRPARSSRSVSRLRPRRPLGTESSRID